MNNDKSMQLAMIITKYQSELLEVWLSGLLGRMIRRDKNAEAELRQQATRFLPMVVQAIERGAGMDIDTAPGKGVRVSITKWKPF